MHGTSCYAWSVTTALALDSTVTIVVRNSRGTIISDQTFTFNADPVVLDANALERERALAARELLAKTNGAQKSRVPQWLRNVLPQSALKTSTN